MNRRQLLKSVIGVAVATAVPAMPFAWRELSYSEIIAETLRKNQQRIADSLYSVNPLYRLIEERIANTESQMVEDVFGGSSPGGHFLAELTKR